MNHVDFYLNQVWRVWIILNYVYIVHLSHVDSPTLNDFKPNLHHAKNFEAKYPMNHIWVTLIPLSITFESASNHFEKLKRTLHRTITLKTLKQKLFTYSTLENTITSVYSNFLSKVWRTAATYTLLGPRCFASRGQKMLADELSLNLT